jgi:hypothetical protein
MKKAIWFSRHQPSREQIEDAALLGYEILVTQEGLALGAMELKDEADVKACVTALLALVQERQAGAIFGVFAAPILAQIARSYQDICQIGIATNQDIPCFAAWNVARPAEGGKPTFQHKKWLGIGPLNQNSLRWLK